MITEIKQNEGVILFFGGVANSGDSHWPNRRILRRQTVGPAILVKERFRIHLVLIFVGTQPSGHYNQRVNGRSVLDGLFFHRNFFSVVRI